MAEVYSVTSRPLYQVHFSYRLSYSTYIVVFSRGNFAVWQKNSNLTRTFGFIRRVLRPLAEMKNVVFVLGGPGSGKGTQCEKIVQNFGYVHLSAGDLLREERAKPDSKHGELIEDYIRNGKIVPVEITCSLLKEAMDKSKSENFLIDGFPRSEDNLNGWNREMSAVVNLQFVLYFDCPEEVCLDRCLKRGSAGSGRSDDNVESLKKRFKTYVGDTMPIIDHYKGLNLLRKVDANRDPDEVFNDVRSIFEKV